MNTGIIINSVEKLKALYAYISRSNCKSNIASALLRFETIMLYPDKRIVRLALYHPRWKVRKKNQNRVLRWIHLQFKRTPGTYIEFAPGGRGLTPSTPDIWILPERQKRSDYE